MAVSSTSETPVRFKARRQGRQHSEETRAKMSQAKLGRKHTPEHKARIAESLRRWNAQAEEWQRRRGWRRFLSDEEAADYRILRWRCRYSEVEALRAIGRGDLLSE